jgi:hypothetical protein
VLRQMLQAGRETGFGSGSRPDRIA